MPDDNREARTERLLADWHAYNHRIQADLAHSQQMAREKAETLLKLRQDYSAQQIAEMLGVTRQAIYDVLRDAGALDPEADSEGHLDEQVRQALRTYHRALKTAEETLKPFAVDGLSVTQGRREMLAGVLDQLHEAEDNYDAALERAGRLAPHRMRPRRFLIQHLDMSERSNGSNWTAYRQTLEGAMVAADAVFDPSNLAVRQEIQDSTPRREVIERSGGQECVGSIECTPQDKPPKAAPLAAQKVPDYGQRSPHLWRDESPTPLDSPGTYTDAHTAWLYLINRYLELQESLVIPIWSEHMFVLDAFRHYPSWLKKEVAP